MFNTPILFIVYNRPEITIRVFKEIKKQKPKTLFIAADGPRNHNEDDVEKCKVTRKKVLEEIDWDCEVKTLFRDSNLGCGKAVSGAIDWFFENVEMGIILEDDCLPHPSFFQFCETLLEKYKDQEQVYAISGNNFQNGVLRGRASYYFSNYMFIWGWATWRRAWNEYDFDMIGLETFKKQNLILNIDKRKEFREYWYSVFDKVVNKEIDTWDYQWLFAIWKKQRVSIVPNHNLVSNIGFGEDATHTISHSALSGIPTKDIGKLKHPARIRVNKKADSYNTNNVYSIDKAKLNNFNWANSISFFKKKIKYLLPPIITSLIKKYKGC